jgi:hypothetical protein
VIVEYVTAAFLVCAVAFAFLRAFQTEDSIDLGWLAVGCLIVAVWLLPELLVVARLHAGTP